MANRRTQLIDRGRVSRSNALKRACRKGGRGRERPIPRTLRSVSEEEPTGYHLDCWPVRLVFAIAEAKWNGNQATRRSGAQGARRQDFRLPSRSTSWSHRGSTTRHSISTIRTRMHIVVWTRIWPLYHRVFVKVGSEYINRFWIVSLSNSLVTSVRLQLARLGLRSQAGVGTRRNSVEYWYRAPHLYLCGSSRKMRERLAVTKPGHRYARGR